MTTVSDTVKTRLCVISDTHAKAPLPEGDRRHAYRVHPNGLPLPKADILLHAGDITRVGRIEEYDVMIDMLKAADAELKIVIAGNHDITLDQEFCNGPGKNRYRRANEDLKKVRHLWTGEEARKAGIVYLEEGTRTFTLSNGAVFTSSPAKRANGIIELTPPQIYTSPYQPEFSGWAFAYERSEDRYNPSSGVSRSQAQNPIPSWPEIDIMLTHGPPYKILDHTASGNDVGCENLLRAVKRCRPRLHCFGHIHEGWGAERLDWSRKVSETVQEDLQKVYEDRSAYVDLSEEGKHPLKFGEETVFINAAIMDVFYKPRNAPWVVDLNLPLAKREESSTSTPSVG